MYTLVNEFCIANTLYFHVNLHPYLNLCKINFTFADSDWCGFVTQFTMVTNYFLRCRKFAQPI